MNKRPITQKDERKLLKEQIEDELNRFKITIAEKWESSVFSENVRRIRRNILLCSSLIILLSADIIQLNKIPIANTEISITHNWPMILLIILGSYSVFKYYIESKLFFYRAKAALCEAEKYKPRFAEHTDKAMKLFEKERRKGMTSFRVSQCFELIFPHLFFSFAILFALIRFLSK